MSEDFANSKQMGNGERYLEFSLGEEMYAIPLLKVREVIPVPETTPIPRAPSHFLGIMNLRGHVISVVDLRKKLSVAPKEHREEAVVIVDIDGMNIGVIVDSINKVLAFDHSEIKDVPEIQTQLSAKYIEGVYQKEDSLTVLVDIEKVLDLSDMKIASRNQQNAA